MSFWKNWASRAELFDQKLEPNPSQTEPSLGSGATLGYNNIAYLTTSYLVYHCSYLDEHQLVIFISWWTFPKYYHILFIILHSFMNITLRTSYVDEQGPRILICYLSFFSSYLTLTSYLDEHVPLKFIAYLSLFICYLSLFIAYLSLSYLN